MLNNPKILAIATVILWSFFAPLGKMISNKSEFLFINFSFFISFLTFLTGFTRLHGRSPWRRLKDLRPVHLFFGLFGFFFYWAALVQSFREFSSASGTTVLNYTWPVFTVVFTELFFRRTGKSPLQRMVEFLGIGLGFASVLVLATGGDIFAFELTHIKGLLWGLAAGASYGFYGAYSGTLNRETQILFLMASAGISALAMIPLSLAELHVLSQVTWRDVLLVAVVGCAIDGGGYFLWTSANVAAREQQVDISAVSSIVFFLPLISVVFVSLVLGEGEIFKPYFAVTLALLISGSVVCQRNREITRRIEAWFGHGRP